MRCSNCNQEVNPEMNFCPICGNALKDDDEEIILPQLIDDNEENDISEEAYDENNYYDDLEDSLKTKEYNFAEEQQQNIDPLSQTKTITSLPSFIDDVNNQIDLNNAEAEQEAASSAYDKVNDMIDKVDTKNKKKDKNNKNSKKKKYFIIIGIISLAILLSIILLFSVFRKGENGNVDDNYNHINAINKALDKYYDKEGKDYTDIIDVLKKVYNNKKKLKDVRKETKNKVDEWINDYFEEEAANSNEFLNLTEEYKNLVDKLHEKAVYKETELLEYKDYNEFIDKIDDIYKDSKSYYDAVDYYTEQEYNDAYYMFGKVEKESKFYNKALNYQNKIVNEIISAINKDISKIESNISNKTDEEKLNIYTQIEDVIIKYDRIYYNVGLSSKNAYNNILNNYKNKVTEYNNKVINKEQTKPTPKPSETPTTPVNPDSTEEEDEEESTTTN